MVLVSGVVSCSNGDSYDAVGAGRLAVLTGLAVDTPPGFRSDVVATPGGGAGGPGLVPVPGSGGGPGGGAWLLGTGGVGLSEEAMITFYTERMMQHSLRHIRVYCTGPQQGYDESIFTRAVDGWSSEGLTRFRIVAHWSGSVEAGWGLNQEIVTVADLVDEYPAGKVLEFRCRFVSDQLLLGLAAKYGYSTTRITGDGWDPNIAARPTTRAIPYRSPYADGE